MSSRQKLGKILENKMSSVKVVHLNLYFEIKFNLDDSCSRKLSLKVQLLMAHFEDLPLCLFTKYYSFPWKSI